MDAVVRAINPGMIFRSYLEGLEDLTLSSLRHILSFHYQGKSTTALTTATHISSGAPRESTKFSNQSIGFQTKEPVCLLGGGHSVKIRL